MRVGALAVLGCVLIVVQVQPANAQLCHEIAGPAPAPAAARRVPHGSRAIGWAVGTFGQAATIDDGWYASVILHARVDAPRWSLSAALPSYVLSVDGEPGSGLGDAVVGGGLRLTSIRAVEVRATVATSLPTAQGRYFGMGHVMLMPAIELRGHGGRWRWLAEGGAGWALGADPAHIGHTFSKVAPMNGREVTARGSLGYAFDQQWTVWARGAVATPLETGTTRAAVGLGLRALLGRWAGQADLEVGARGRPYLTRVGLGLARTF